MAAKINTVMRVSDVDVNKIAMGTPKILDNGGRMIYLNYNNEALCVQLPAMVCPYGLSSWPGENGAAEKLNIDLSMTGYDSVPTMKDCFQLFKDLETFVMTKGLENSSTWFKKKFTSLDVISAVFTPLVKFSKDKETHEISNKYPPVIRLNIAKKDGKALVDVYNDKRQLIPFDGVDWNKATVTAIVQITSIWVIAGRFGVTVKPKQLKVVPVQKISGYAFVEDDEDCEVDGGDDEC